MIDITMKRNPTGRMTTPQDVANAIVALSARWHRVHQRRHHQRGRRRVHHRRLRDRRSVADSVSVWRWREGARRVIVVGSVNIDLVVTVDRLPAPGETVIGGDLRPDTTAARAAIRPWRRRDSARPPFVGAVGDDEFGVRPAWPGRREGIDGRPSSGPCPACRPGSPSILVDAAGENSIVVASGANGALRARMTSRRRRAGDSGRGAATSCSSATRSRPRPPGPHCVRTRGRRPDDPQSGSGGRPGWDDHRAGRRRHAQRGRAGGPGDGSRRGRYARW